MTVGANEAEGGRFLMALITSITAWVSALEDEITVILVCLGQNSSTSEICSALVLDMST